MKLQIPKSFKVLAPGSSLRRRVAYSLAIVRLSLVPVIFLSVYYLFQTGWIVDRIVSFDAPAATLSQQASIEMLEARRAERNYFLLYDPAYLRTNRESVGKMEQIFRALRDLNPADQSVTDQALDSIRLYRQQFETAVSAITKQGQAPPAERVGAVVQAYEDDLNNLLKGAKYKRRAQLIDELRTRLGSFDAQITKTVQEGNPTLQQITPDLQSAGQKILELTSELEARNWKRIEADHNKARRLISHAEWALGIVSVITLVVSIWISFMLPRQVVKPLLSLKEAVDHAAAGNYEIEVDIRGEGEVVQLAKSIRLLIGHVRETI